MLIKMRKGLDIPLRGAPSPRIEKGDQVRSVALLGGDYPGLKPQLLVQPGERVRTGQALFVDKRDRQAIYTAPAAGTVIEVNRGPRRSLLSVVIDVDDGAADSAPVAAQATASVQQRLCAGGLWSAFRTRPYGRVPHSSSRPQAIFVTAMDTRPLAADPALIVDRHTEAFVAGLEALTALTDGTVYLCTAASWDGPTGAGVTRVAQARFRGPHPAGLPGTHIHHLFPVGAERTVWYVGYQDVIAMGRWIAEGVAWTDRYVALGGPGVRDPRILRTRLGTDITALLRDELIESATPLQTAPWRAISGSVLDGRAATSVEAYLGRYHQQISVIPKGPGRRLLGWMGARSPAPSFYGLGRRKRKSPPELSTGLGGQPTAMLAVDAFENLMPMDLLPVPLLRALLIGDTQTAQALGCLELEPEDLALCTFMCPSKNDYGAVLRVNLDRIEREG